MIETASRRKCRGYLGHGQGDRNREETNQRPTEAIEAPPTLQKPTWNEVMHPAKMQMIESEIA